MKNRILLTNLLLLISLISTGQVQPQWTRSITSLPNSAYMFPVKTLNDANNNVLVLCAYGATAGVNNKVVLNKFNSSGLLLWSCVFDNNGIGSPRGFDIVLDATDNCYVAGGFMDGPPKILLMKVTSTGSVSWVNDSSTAPINGSFSQIFMHNNKLYVGGSSGLAVFTSSGVEQWSVNTSVNRFAIDQLGRVILSGYSGSDNIFRYDSLGILEFSDSSIQAQRICIDGDNNIILLSEFPGYQLAKFDSGGGFLWMRDSFPPPPPFGDIGFDVVVDYYNNIVVTGISDTMFKFNPDGNLLWRRTMNGLDNYVSSVKMFQNRLLVAGSVYDSGQYDVGVALFNSYGIQNWSGTYNSNSQQEFSVDVTMDNSGIYVIEDSISNTVVMKFDVPFFNGDTIDYNLVCVDSVWYDPTNPIFINVTIYNGDIPHMNYPSVMIISPNGDTISNRYNLVNFFAHIGNTTQTYTDTISVQGITDFAGYTFVISEGFGDTSAVIGWCSALSVNELDDNNFSIFPNPASNQLTVSFLKTGSVGFQIFDQAGRLVLSKNLAPGERTMDISSLSQGIYILKSLDLASQLLFLKIN